MRFGSLAVRSAAPEPHLEQAVDEKGQVTSDATVAPSIDSDIEAFEKEKKEVQHGIRVIEATAITWSTGALVAAYTA